MILIVTALHCEAKPLIKHFSLKKDTSSASFPVYSNGDISMIVSGTGMIKSAVATAYLLAENSRKAAIFNIGICGSVSMDYETGTLIVANKVINYVTKRTFFPDILIDHGFPEGFVISFPSPVTSGCPAEIKGGFADMEAAGFMEAASVFLAAHNIYCLKVVSDHMEQTKLELDFVSGLVQKNLSNIERIINLSKALNENTADVLSSADFDMLGSISERLMLSETLRHEFRKLAMHYKIRTKNGLDRLGPFLDTHAKSKHEGKILFDEIRKILAGD